MWKREDTFLEENIVEAKNKKKLRGKEEKLVWKNNKARKKTNVQGNKRRKKQYCDDIDKDESEEIYIKCRKKICF